MPLYLSIVPDLFAGYNIADSSPVGGSEMAQDKRFCTNCGAPLEKGGRFCGQCGQPVSITSGVPSPQSAGTPTPLIATATSGEAVLGIIPNVTRKKGLFGQEAYNIVFTDRKVIFAILTAAMIKEESRRQQAEAKEKNQGFLASTFAYMTAGYSVYRRYFSMPPEAIITESPENFFVDMGRVKSARIDEGRRVRQANGIYTHVDSKIVIDTTNGKYSFNLPGEAVDAAGGVLKKVGLSK